MNKCPCCGSVSDAKFLVSLDTNAALISGCVVRLLPREAEILKILADSFPAPVKNPDLTFSVYGNSEQGSHRTMQVIVSNLNRKLKTYGYRVSNVYGVGYVLADMNRAAA